MKPPRMWDEERSSPWLLALYAAAAALTLALSAGAINSPKILELSGVGRPDLLSDLGIAVQHDLKGVGENLQDHLQLRTVYRIHGAPTVNTLYRNWITRAGMGLQYLLTRSGPMTMPPRMLKEPGTG